MTEPRNFECPATKEPCTDGRCTREICCERERLRVTSTNERIKREDRKQTAKMWDAIRSSPLWPPKT
jgi:hypothetical protein